METTLKMRNLGRIARMSIFCGLLIATGLCSSERITPALAEARTVTTTTHLPVAKEILDRQTNEAVRLANAEAIFHVSFDPNGGTNVEVTADLHGTGNGRVSGRTYDFTGAGLVKLNAGRPPAPEFVLVCNGHLLSPGTHTFQPITIVLSLTIDLEGRVSAAVRELKGQPL